MKEIRNLSLVMDFYELTMSQVYFEDGLKDTEVVFDLFYRRNPDDGGLAVFCGLEQVIDYVQNLRFEPEDIAYLRSLNQFTPAFLDYPLYRGSLGDSRGNTCVPPRAAGAGQGSHH